MIGNAYICITFYDVCCVRAVVYVSQLNYSLHVMSSGTLCTVFFDSIIILVIAHSVKLLTATRLHLCVRLLRDFSFF